MHQKQPPAKVAFAYFGCAKESPMKNNAIDNMIKALTIFIILLLCILLRNAAKNFPTANIRAISSALPTKSKDIQGSLKMNLL